MLNYLCRHGLVEPSAGKKRGRGTARQYSFEDLLLLRVLEKLLTQGISPLRLKRSLRAIQMRGKSQKDLISKKFIATDGREIFIGDHGVFERISTGQLVFAFVFQLDAVRAQVDGSLKEIDSAA